MPAETAPHERTLMAWPTEQRRDAAWKGQLDLAREVYAEVASAIAAHEPVTLVASPGEAAEAERRTSAEVEVVALPIDDAWMRDVGPIVVVAPDGTRHAVHFRFNAWGHKYGEYAADARVAHELAGRLALPVHDAPLVLEGGSIAVDGEGVLVTTERCLLNPNRNPDLTRAAIEEALREWLGVTDVVWLPDGIAEDDETDGHVDNVVAFVSPRRALLQGCDDPANRNHAIAAENRRRLESAGIEVVEIPMLPYATVADVRVPVPYVNAYAANGVVVVPTTGHAADGDVLALIAELYPRRAVTAVPAVVLALGGGGVHCITQQVPACAPVPA
jgi:agmatine deiminase